MTLPDLDPDLDGWLMAAHRDDFEEFVHATGRRVHYAALMLCGDHHLAEDLAQTTYVKVYAHWPKVSRMESPLAYTHKVLVNAFLSHRRLRRTAERPSGEIPESVVVADDRVARLDLVSALRQLPRRDRAVLVLRYWEDLSVARTAELLGIREDACRRRTARALDRLRALVPSLNDSRLFGQSLGQSLGQSEVES